MIRHSQFFEALAALPAGASEWDAIAAGYFALRLFEDWLVLGPIQIANDRTTPRILKHIQGLPSKHRAEREVLGQIVNGLVNGADASPRSVSAPVLAYGAVLENNGQWKLAASAYMSVADALEAQSCLHLEDLTAAGFARRKQAFCLRNVQDYAGAETSYARAIALGEQANDDQVYLQAKLGLAAMMRVRGNLPAAEEALNALLLECDQRSAKAAEIVRPDVLHARGSLRHDRGQYTDAIIDLFAAYRSSQNPDNKEFILNDLGGCAEEAGFPELARNVLNIVVLTSHRQLARQFAIVNLLVNAVADHNEVEFSRLCQLWQPDYCDPILNAHARLFIARGVEKFNTREKALDAYREAAAYAESVEVHKAQFEALRDIERLEHDAPRKDTSTPRVPNPVPEVLLSLTQALSEIYTLAATQQGYAILA